MIQAQDAVATHGPPERMLPAALPMSVLSGPSTNMLALPGLRPSRLRAVAAATDASRCEAPSMLSPPQLRPEPTTLNGLAVAARPADLPVPPTVPLESCVVQHRSAPQVELKRHLTRSEVARADYLERDSAGGPPPTVPQLAGSRASAGAGGASSPDRGPCSGVRSSSLRFPATAAASACATAVCAEAAGSAAPMSAQNISAETISPVMLQRSMPAMPPEASTSATPSRKLQAELSRSMDESFGASVCTHKTNWHATRSPAEPGSLFSCMSTAAPADRSMASSPRQAKPVMASQLHEMLDAELEPAAPMQSAFVEQGETRSHHHEIVRPRRHGRSASPSKSLASSAVQKIPDWQPIAASMPPFVNTPVAVTMPDAGFAPWFPPPLPPVPCELTARLDALEKDKHSLPHSAEVEVDAGQAHIGQSRLEQTVETLQQQLSVLECNAVQNSALQAQLAQCRVDWAEQVARLEASVATSKMPAELEPDSQRPEEQLMYKSLASEVQLLRQDLQAAREERDQERRGRQELEHQHQDTFLENKRLHNDVGKLRDDHGAEQQARQEAEQHHREAICRLRNDHDAEQQARQEAEQRHREAKAEVDRMDTDFRKLQSDHSAEQQARQNAEQKHQEVEADAVSLREDLRRFQEQRAEMERTLRANLETLRAQLSEMEGARDLERQDMGLLKQRLQSLTAEREKAEAERDQFQNDKVSLMKAHLQQEQTEHAMQQALAEVQQKLSSVTVERDQLQSDNVHLKLAKEQREESEASLRRGLEEERNKSHKLGSELNSMDAKLRTVMDEADLKASELRVKLETHESEHEKALERHRGSNGDMQQRIAELQQKLTSVETERDQLQSDNGHLKRAKEQREESEASLRRGLEEERNKSHKLGSELNSMEAKLRTVMDEAEVKASEMRVKLETHEREHEKALERHSGSKSDMQQRLVELQRNLTSAEIERDQLQSDNGHLKRAKEQREESEASLRRSLDEEGSTSWNLRSSLQSVEARLQVVIDESDLKVKQLREQLETSRRENQKTLESQAGSENDLQRTLVQLQENLNSVEVERDHLQSRSLDLIRVKEQLEESEASLRRGLEIERNTSQMLRSELESVEAKLKTFADESELKDMQRNLVELQKRCASVEAERDQLQSDNRHLQRAKQQREESEVSLRRGLQQERNTALNLRSQLESVEAKLKTRTDTAELTAEVSSVTDSPRLEWKVEDDNRWTSESDLHPQRAVAAASLEDGAQTDHPIELSTTESRPDSTLAVEKRPSLRVSTFDWGAEIGNRTSTSSTDSRLSSKMSEDLGGYRLELAAQDQSRQSSFASDNMSLQGELATLSVDLQQFGLKSPSQHKQQQATEIDLSNKEISAGALKSPGAGFPVVVDLNEMALTGETHDPEYKVDLDALDDEDLGNSTPEIWNIHGDTSTRTIEVDLSAAYMYEGESY